MAHPFSEAGWLARHEIRHPSNRRRPIQAITRSSWWQLHKRLRGRLDDVLKGRILSPCVVVKMDVEGCEGLVLEGARETLRAGAVKLCIFELEDSSILQRHGSSVEKVLNAFEENGYSIHYGDEDHPRLGRKVDERDALRGNSLACKDEQVKERLSL